MIILKHNSLIKYGIKIKDEVIIFKYVAYLRYNLIDVIKVEDTININDEVSFIDAKKIMLGTLDLLNKKIN